MPKLPYTEADFIGMKKNELAHLITNQKECWPGPGSFNASKTRIGNIKTVLLDPKNGFLKEVSESEPELNPPLASENYAPKSSSHIPVASASQMKDIISSEFSNDAQSQGSHESSPAPVPVRVLLNDCRFDPVRKIIVNIQVPVDGIQYDEDCKPWVSAQKLVAEVQNSISPIQGFVRLSSPFPFDESYMEYFAKFTEGKLENSDFRPTHLMLSDLNAVHVHVEHAEDNFIQENIASVSTASGSLSTQDKVIFWLKNAAKTRESYDLFCNSHNRVLQNPDIVKIWKFAAAFHRVYYRSKCPISGTRVFLSAIRAALDVGETWLSDALDGDRLVGIYGPGGPHAADQVKEELLQCQETAQGRTALLKFLRDWEESNPCIV
ncbi:hypothetical protein CVT25_010618 [Psilocybe cyanescens]|uniref:Uncharacterized protein n=1 Tax=Psilocybe cyanescens TaxID=93625 RepID=A0A409VWR7_PSICY|nr:hypothetical protein CVT25_010618 [Psilocybe cyanescens]